MAIRIKSLLVSGPVVVPLNSGVTVRLSPGQSSRELDDVEVAENPKVDKLAGRGVIEVESTDSDDDGEDEGKAAGKDTADKADTEDKAGGGRTTTRKRRTSSD